MCGNAIKVMCVLVVTWSVQGRSEDVSNQHLHINKN